MSAPAATVVIPTYNRRALVRRALDSVLAQTRADFELIVVDDGSSDGTVESLDGLDPRLVIVRQPHRGVAAARNAGIRRGSAPVVAFLDSDNAWLPDHLAVELEMLERHPEAVLASTSRHYIIRGQAPVRRTVVEDLLDQSLVTNTYGYTSGVAVHRWALERVGGFDEQMPAFEDTDLFVRLAMLGPFAFLRRRTFSRMRTPASLMSVAGEIGAYLTAIERHGLKLEQLLSATCGMERLAPQARGVAVVARALMALDAGRDEELRTLLARACELQPELGHEPQLFAFRVAHHLPSVRDRASRGRAYLRCADAWPDDRSVAAHWLRGYAALVGLREKRPRLVYGAVRGWRLRGTLATLGFAWVNVPRELLRALDERAAVRAYAAIEGASSRPGRSRGYPAHLSSPGNVRDDH